jgi:1-acyl-sn-glycerol-3-phosphate acyltransferase
MRMALRLVRVGLHLAIGFDAALPFGRLREKSRGAFLRWWAGGLLAALGVHIRIEGRDRLPPGPILIVANHVSWLDVIALVAIHPAIFVCKAEVASWPGLGWLLERAGTVFIRRGGFRDVWRVNIELRERLHAGHSVAAFPEGTTTYGDQVLAFRPALFQPAVERGVPVCPVAISYSSGAAAYVGETTLMSSLLSVCSAPRLEVRLTMLPPLAPGLRRRDAARMARLAICAALAVPDAAQARPSDRPPLPHSASDYATIVFSDDNR